MKKILLFMVLGLTVLSSTAVYGDSVRALAIGSPIALVDDTFILNTFASRLQSFPNAVFFSVSGATGDVVFAPGVALRLADAFAIMYIYDQPAGIFGSTVPTALTFHTTIAGGTLMNTPLNLWYGLKSGTFQFGVFYRMSFYSADAQGYNTNTGAVNARDYATYFLHTITPSITLFTDDKGSALDAALSLGIQDLNNFEDTAGTNKVTVPFFRTLGLTLQYTMQLVPEFRLAFRLIANHQNNSYDDFTITGAVNTTNGKALSHVNTIGLTAGFKYQLTPAIALFFDLVAQDAQTYNGATIANAWTLPPSNNLGAEWVVDAWAFRVGMNTRYVHTVTSTIVDGRIAVNNYANTITYTPNIGIGYKALPWAINLLIDAQIFTKTIAMINTGAAFSPVVRFQLNYVF